METALVTGGAGFLGSHLCDRLLHEKMRVICVDNLITGNVNNTTHMRRHPGKIRFEELDVTRELRIEEKIHWIFHFASPASPVDYMKYPLETLRAGSIGTMQMLGLAVQHKARFMLASTSEVYGDPLVNPQPESYWGNVNSIGPRSMYDEAKRFAEATTMVAQRSYGIDTRIVRIFNTYGERMRMNDGRAIPTFICQALRGEDITVFGDGTQTRSITYVSDTVDGIYKLMNALPVVGPVNIGNPDEASIVDIAKEIIEWTGSKSKLVHKPLPTDDPKQRRPDITKATQLLNWKPAITREVGIKKTIEYFKTICH